MPRPSDLTDTESIPEKLLDRGTPLPPSGSRRAGEHVRVLLASGGYEFHFQIQVQGIPFSKLK
jgi:hypothetical protein